MGFTIVELLVVIGVLGIITLSLLATLDPVGQLQKGWDTQRKSDLAQIQKALEVYYQDNGRYPAHSVQAGLDYRVVRADNSTSDWGTQWTPYIAKLPKDPSLSGKRYIYFATSTGQAYYLYANLDRGAKDLQACNGGNSCVSITSNAIPAASCGSLTQLCNYGVSSSNVSP